MKYYGLHCSFFFLLLLVVSEIHSENLVDDKTRSKEEELSLRLGNSLYQESRVDESLLVFQDFIVLYPESDRRSKVLEKIAIIYEEKQQFVSAQAMYHQLFQELGFSSKGLKYYLEVARLLEIMGDIEGAQQIYVVVRKALPDSDLALKARRRLKLNQFFEENSVENMMPMHEMDKEKKVNMKTK